MSKSACSLDYAMRQLRYWQGAVKRLSAVSKTPSLFTTPSLFASDASDASDAKEKDEEKRDLPPTPPIESKEEDKESNIYIYTRARDGQNVDNSVDNSADKKADNPTDNSADDPANKSAVPQNAQEVIDYFRQKGYKSDPLYFYGYNSGRGWMGANSTPILNWRAFADSWERRFLYKNPSMAKTEAKKHTYTPVKNYQRHDWILCEERCANFNGKVCGCGYKVPPEKLQCPRPPEECPHFKALG